jgi:hypothetical protein
VLVPAASSFGVDDLELSNGLGSVYLFGIVTPDIPTVEVLVHAREFLMVVRIQEPLRRLTCGFALLVTLSTLDTDACG